MTGTHAGSEVAAHYEGLLAEHYTWMLGGDFDELADRSASFPAIRPVHADVCAGLDAIVRPRSITAAVCMGPSSPGPVACASTRPAGPGRRRVAVRDYQAAAVPWPAARAWTRRELRHYLDAAADPARHARPTRCPPWTVRDLTAHLAATFQRFADMLDNGRAGNMDNPFPPDHLAEENLRAVRRFSGDPVRHLDRQARRFLDAVRSPDERMPHQFGPIPVGLQVMFGLNELVVHHDDLADAVGRHYRPTDEIVTALAAMYGAVFGLPPGDDPWARLLAATGRG